MRPLLITVGSILGITILFTFSVKCFHFSFYQKSSSVQSTIYLVSAITHLYIIINLLLVPNSITDRTSHGIKMFKEKNFSFRTIANI